MLCVCVFCIKYPLIPCEATYNELCLRSQHKEYYEIGTCTAIREAFRDRLNKSGERIVRNQ